MTEFKHKIKLTVENQSYRDASETDWAAFLAYKKARFPLVKSRAWMWCLGLILCSLIGVWILYSVCPDPKIEKHTSTNVVPTALSNLQQGEANVSAIIDESAEASRVEKPINDQQSVIANATENIQETKLEQNQSTLFIKDFKKTEIEKYNENSTSSLQIESSVGPLFSNRHSIDIDLSEILKTKSRTETSCSNS